MKISLYILAAFALGMALTVVVIIIQENTLDAPGTEMGSPGTPQAISAGGITSDAFAYIDSLAQEVENTTTWYVPGGVDEAMPAQALNEAGASPSSAAGGFAHIPPLPQRTVIVNKDMPFQVTVPEGWKVISWSNPVNLLFRDHTFFRLDTGPWVTSQSEFAELSMREIQALHPEMVLESDDETLVIDGKRWQLQVFRRPIGQDDAHEISLLTYGSRRGSYRMIIEGERSLMLESASAIGLVMASFRFPPDNFVPDTADLVRIYLDGERIEY